MVAYKTDRVDVASAEGGGLYRGGLQNKANTVLYLSSTPSRVLPGGQVGLVRPPS